jgi:hypothetical protein
MPSFLKLFKRKTSSSGPFDINSAAATAADVSSKNSGSYRKESTLAFPNVTFTSSEVESSPPNYEASKSIEHQIIDVLIRSYNDGDLENVPTRKHMMFIDDQSRHPHDILQALLHLCHQVFRIPSKTYFMSGHRNPIHDDEDLGDKDMKVLTFLEEVFQTRRWKQAGVIIDNFNEHTRDSRVDVVKTEYDFVVRSCQNIAGQGT